MHGPSHHENLREPFRALPSSKHSTRATAPFAPKRSHHRAIAQPEGMNAKFMNKNYAPNHNRRENEQ